MLRFCFCDAGACMKCRFLQCLLMTVVVLSLIMAGLPAAVHADNEGAPVEEVDPGQFSSEVSEELGFEDELTDEEMLDIFMRFSDYMLRVDAETSALLNDLVQYRQLLMLGDAFAEDSAELESRDLPIDGLAYNAGTIRRNAPPANDLAYLVDCVYAYNDFDGDAVKTMEVLLIPEYIRDHWECDLHQLLENVGRASYGMIGYTVMTFECTDEPGYDHTPLGMASVHVVWNPIYSTGDADSIINENGGTIDLDRYVYLDGETVLRCYASRFIKCAAVKKISPFRSEYPKVPDVPIHLLFPVGEAGEYAVFLFRQPVFLFRVRKCPDHKDHIPGEVPHGLQTLQVLFHIFRRVSVHLIPIGRRRDRHAAEGKVFIQYVKGSSISTSAAGHHRSTDFELLREGGAVEQPVQEGQQRSVR